jgi:hypothetical protein
MAFKMKGPFLYGSSPLKKDKPTYEEAWEAMKSYFPEGKSYEEKKTKSGTVYTDDEKGYRKFVNDAKLWNAKQKNKNVVRVERKKPTLSSDTWRKPMKPVAEPKTKTKKKFKDTKVGKFLSKKRTNQPRKKYNPRLNRFE